MIASELLAGQAGQGLNAGKCEKERLFQLLERGGWQHYFEQLQAAQLGMAGYWFLANSCLEACLINQGALLKHWIVGLEVSQSAPRSLLLKHADPLMSAYAASLLWHLHAQASSRRIPFLKLCSPSLPEDPQHCLREICEQFEQSSEQDGVLIVFSEQAWSAPFVTQNQQLLPLLSDSLTCLQPAEDNSMTGRVYRFLQALPGLAEVSQSQLAQALAVSERTLSRQLADEQSSFRELLTRQRNARAVAGLCRGESIDALAHVLGFSERAAFERAFKGWQGVTPAKFQAQYRRLSRDVNVELLIAPEHLPTLPALATELLAMAQDEDASLDAMAELVERDPVLTAKLLNIACSAYYGLPAGTRIKDAVVRVFGVDRLRYLALSMLAAGSFKTAHCPAFSLGDFWLISLAVAQLASDCYRLAGKDAEAQADIYLAGLLHAIGRLVLVQCFPAKMQSLLEQLEQPPAPQEMLAMEKLRLGVDASEAGALLVAKWQLPRPVSLFMRQLAAEKDAMSEQARLILCLHEYVLACLCECESRIQSAAEQLGLSLALSPSSLEPLLSRFAEQLPALKTMAKSL